MPFAIILRKDIGLSMAAAISAYLQANTWLVMEILVAFVIMVVVAAAFSMIGSVTELMADWGGHARKSKLLRDKSLKLTDADKKHLRAYLPFYTGLPAHAQQKFEWRTAYLLEVKHFESREGYDLQRLDKLLVCAFTVKLTFGFKQFELPHLSRFIFYPATYYNKKTGAWHKGEVDLKGTVVLSAENMAEGIANPNDGVHLVIHELAHAVYFENFIKNHHYLFINQARFMEWKQMAEEEMLNMHMSKEHPFRDYAATRIEEFFAVSSEYFFETPHYFKEKLPNLYRATCLVYKQDPSRYIKPGAS